MQSLNHDIRLQLFKDLIVSEVRELWKVEDWLILLNLIVVIVVDLYNTLSDKVHLLDIALVADNCFAWGVKSAEHIDDQLIGEPSLTLIEEMVE